MRSFGQQMIKALRSTRWAFLSFGLCLLALQQVGTGSLAVAAGLRSSSASSADSAFSQNAATAATVAWGSNREGLCYDAVLTNRRQTGLVLAASVCRMRLLTAVLPRFHNNSRPTVLRTRAIFCEFSRLRSILHPQLAFLAHTATVLC